MGVIAKYVANVFPLAVRNGSMIADPKANLPLNYTVVATLDSTSRLNFLTVATTPL